MKRWSEWEMTCIWASVSRYCDCVSTILFRKPFKPLFTRLTCRARWASNRESYSSVQSSWGQVLVRFDPLLTPLEKRCCTFGPDLIIVHSWAWHHPQLLLPPPLQSQSELHGIKMSAVKINSHLFKLKLHEPNICWMNWICTYRSFFTL